MIQKTVNKLPKSLVEVSVGVPWVDIAPIWEETLQRLNQDLEIPGFRKGSVPANLAEQHLGQKVQDEFLKTIMPQKLIEALQGTNVVPIDYPKYQLTSFNKGGDLNFKAVVTERPNVSIGDYKNIVVTRPVVKAITDEDINKVIEDLFKRWKARQPQTPAPAQTPPPAGGPPPAAGPTDGTTGSLSFNQPAVENGTAPVIDTPNDDFAKAVGALSLVDLKTKIRADLENEAKFNNELDFEELILQKVADLTQVEVPDILVEDELNRMLVSLQRRVSDAGMLLDDYLKRNGMDLNGWKNKYREQAEKNVKMELGLSEVGRGENVQVTDADLQAEIQRIPDPRMKSQFESEEARMQLRHSLRQMKTLDLLKTLVKAA